MIIALMAIMVAGGLTFAIPGMEPAQAAMISSNPNLRVSAEGQNAGNVIAHTNIVEVVIIDDLTDEMDKKPRVTVDGDSLEMKFSSGTWYGYFVSDEFPFVSVSGGMIDATAYIRNAPVSVGNIQTIASDVGEFDIVYESPRGDQTVTLDLDDPASGVSLDRSSYSRNTQVEITLDDMALNVDPTDEDVWRFDQNGVAGYLRGGDADGAGDTEADDEIEDLTIVTYNQGSTSLLVSTGDSVEYGSSGVEGDNPQGDMNTITSITFTEDGNNETQFINDELRTTDDAPRGLSFSVGYDNKVSPSISFGTANIIINAGDEWSSGEEIGVTLTDPDANTNSEKEDDLSVTATYDRIPTIKVGEPFTLAHEGIEVAYNDTPIPATATPISDILVIDFDETSIDANMYIDINLGTTSILRDYLPNDHTNFIGTTMLNYDVSALENVTAISLVIGSGDPLPLVVGGEDAISRGTVVLTDPTFDPKTDDGDAETDSQEYRDYAIWQALYAGGNTLTATVQDLSLQLTFNANTMLDSAAPIMIDLFTFGLENNLEDNVNKAIYRLELEEDGDDSSDFTGTLEYVGLNQINILERSTYEGTVDAFGDSIILISDDDDVSIDYLDLDSTGGTTKLTAEVDTPSHSGAVSLGSDGYKVGDIVEITVDDADLNVDSEKADVYTVVDGMIVTQVGDSDANPPVPEETEPLRLNDVVGTSSEHIDALNKADDDLRFGELLRVSIDGDLWTMGSCDTDDYTDDTTYGLADTEFTLQETGSATGVFVGTFAVPAQHCPTNADTPVSVTGADISVEYLDFRDDSGAEISVTASAGIRSNTGSVSLDRTVYPVPFGNSGSSSENNSIFETHVDAPIQNGDLTVYVSINDADFDLSSNGIDSIAMDLGEDDDAPLVMKVLRGSEEYMLDEAGGTDKPITETAPDSGIFEYELTVGYTNGPEDSSCPTLSPADIERSKEIKADNEAITLRNTIATTQYAISISDDTITDLPPPDLESLIPEITGGCILQGDILHVVYTDPSDASGSSNTVTDSATFDLRNGVLQSDQTAYLIGSDAIITLIEPDLNLDSDSTETYTLDLIEWDSDADTVNLSDSVFDATPSNLLETGDDTGIFQVVISVPSEINDEFLQRGEEITLTYNDWGPSGSDFVGDKDEEITTTIYTSNFGATIELDQRVYTWTDKVYITVVAPDHNIDSDQVDEIGNTDEYPVRVSTRGHEIEEYKLVETGSDTGIFTGEVILTGFQPHDTDGDGSYEDARGITSGGGPTNGLIETESESGISVSFKFSDGETVSSSALIRWNVGEVQWLEASYPASGTGIVRIIDPDMNLNPEAVDNFDVSVWSDSDGGGIDLTVTETNAATGIFEGTVFFGVGADTSGHRLRVVEGDTVTAQYYDNTLPAPFKETERLRVGATTLIGTIVPPLERAPISDLRAVDSFGNTLDTVSVDNQIQLAADLTNGQDKSQDFAYLIQIQNEDGVTVSLNWITGSLTANQSLSPAASWTPTEAGTYDVTAFVWESIENPQALSPTATIAITVN